MTTSDYCSAISRSSKEPLAGSAPRCTTWLFLEEAGPWGAKVPGDAAISPTVLQALDRAARQFPGLRVQFIRRPGRSRPERTLFLARAMDGAFTLHSQTLRELDALGTLDLAALTLDGSAEIHTPTYFVCVHGQRDLCCAKWGIPIYQALSKIAPDSTWQCSHLGGHRFAPTLLVLPLGPMYGHVQANELPRLHRASLGGDIYDLDRLRGQPNLSQAAQVAEHNLRSTLGEHSLSALRHERSQEFTGGSDEYFRHRGELHQRRVTHTSGPDRQRSCGGGPRKTQLWSVGG